MLHLGQYIPSISTSIILFPPFIYYFYFITTTLLIAGCSSSKDIQDFSIEEISLKEAKKITSEQGYTLKSETLTESDIMIGDSNVFDFIKEASIEGSSVEWEL